MERLYRSSRMNSSMNANQVVPSGVATKSDLSYLNDQSVDLRTAISNSHHAVSSLKIGSPSFDEVGHNLVTYSSLLLRTAEDGHTKISTSSDGINDIFDCNLTVLDIDCHDMVTPEFPYYMRTTATIFCAIILIIGTTGNILVPIVVYRTKELRNSTNIFLINLSFSDLLVLIVCMPTVLIELHSMPEVWLLGQEMCKAVPFVEMVVAHGSILTMMAISFERYYAICKPLKAGYKCTRWRAFVIIVSVWVIAIVTTLPMLWIAELGYSNYVDGSVVPVCLTNANKVWHKLYFVSTMVAFCWSPLLILIIIYVMITKRLFLSDDIRASTNQSHHECSQMRARRQVVYMLAAVIACFFICLLPFRFFTLWLLFSSTDQIKSLGMETYYTALYFCRVMLYLNSAINPILYNLISSKFRDAFLAVVCCRKNNRLLSRHATHTSSSLLSSLKSSLQRNAPTNANGREHHSFLINRGIHHHEKERKKGKALLMVKDHSIDLVVSDPQTDLDESFV